MNGNGEEDSVDTNQAIMGFDASEDGSVRAKSRLEFASGLASGEKS